MATEGRKWKPRSWVWHYFNKLDKSVAKSVAKSAAKCNFCGETIQYLKKLNQMKSHLSCVHDIYHEQNKLMWRDKSKLLWRYFTKNENLTEAICKYCDTVIVVNQQYKLRQHLQYCHSNVLDEICEEIRRTWVSQHFIFDMQRCNIKCIHCEWIFKIFVEIDHLKSHLFQCHKINENSGNHEGINNSNRNIMTQQSVAEENYASTSSHHDNRHEQNAGNQTIQQRDNTKRQDEDNTRQHDSSTRSEDDNHDTASAIWQPWK